MQHFTSSYLNSYFNSSYHDSAVATAPDACEAAVSDSSMKQETIEAKTPSHGKKPRRCQAQGCDVDVNQFGGYSKKRSLCPAHLKATSLQRRKHGDKEWRFCQQIMPVVEDRPIGVSVPLSQCGKLQLLSNFDGLKRSCRDQLTRRRAITSVGRLGRQASTVDVATEAPLATCDGASSDVSMSINNLLWIELEGAALDDSKVSDMRCPSDLPAESLLPAASLATTTTGAGISGLGASFDCGRQQAAVATVASSPENTRPSRTETRPSIETSEQDVYTNALPANQQVLQRWLKQLQSSQPTSVFLLYSTALSSAVRELHTVSDQVLNLKTRQQEIQAWPPAQPAAASMLVQQRLHCSQHSADRCMHEFMGTWTRQQQQQQQQHSMTLGFPVCLPQQTGSNGSKIHFCASEMVPSATAVPSSSSMTPNSMLSHQTGDPASPSSCSDLGRQASGPATSNTSKPSMPGPKSANYFDRRLLQQAQLPVSSSQQGSGGLFAQGMPRNSFSHAQATALLDELLSTAFGLPPIA